ncbi:hypothetical protein KIH74_06490 [Kineosporia sp. J2-2]|uniref:Glycosyl hydrolase family 26 n=1 Tax=Kineosporia corallincola TaxID=2835133 RepID=A0ABS5TEC0_9ACTN|nr:hypothetical protein [Kineosporia corallincola]MBT0768566.1 hypothetical protein [Kineosporia corallincola]
MRRVHPVSVAVAALATATALVAGSAFVNSAAADPAAAPGYASGMPWSDGGFFQHSGQAADDFAAWRGAPVDNVEAYTDRSSWPAQLNPWWAGSVPSTFRAERDDFILSVPLWTDDGDEGSNHDWHELGAEIAAVDPDALVRLGWEMNCCYSHATDAAHWREQFSRAVTQLRRRAPGLRIVFNPNVGPAQNGTEPKVESLYVEGKVDVVAIDAYDWYEPYTSMAAIEAHLTQDYGWDYWYDFARERGLPFGVGEFSVYSGSSASGGDNPRFFEAVYGWLERREAADPGSIRFVSLFDDGSAYCGCAVSDSQNPLAGAAYRAQLARIRGW